MLPYVFTENARDDIIKHATFHEEKQEGLRIRFMNAVNQAADEISNLLTCYAVITNRQKNGERKTFIIS